MSLDVPSFPSRPVPSLPVIYMSKLSLLYIFAPLLASPFIAIKPYARVVYRFSRRRRVATTNDNHLKEAGWSAGWLAGGGGWRRMRPRLDQISVFPWRKIHFIIVLQSSLLAKLDWISSSACSPAPHPFAFPHTFLLPSLIRNACTLSSQWNILYHGLGRRSSSSSRYYK